MQWHATSSESLLLAKAKHFFFFFKSFVSDSLPLSSASFLSLLCLLFHLSHALAATTSSKAHQKSTTTGSKAHQETQIKQTHIKNRIESDPTNPHLIKQSYSGGLVVEIHEKWFQRLECIELHWTFSLSSLADQRHGDRVLGLKFGVRFGWVNMDLMCYWGLFFLFWLWFTEVGR